MYRFKLLSLVALVVLMTVPVQPAAASDGPVSPQRHGGELQPAALLACDPDGVQDSGAIYRICMPALVDWNGDLVVYAHGYVSPTEPVGIPEDQMILPGGLSIADVVTWQGYGFATTSYSTNGLAVIEAGADLVDVVDIFATSKGPPDKVYLVGVSEGGLITVLSVEGHPETFDGGLAMCGPNGDFAQQINHIGDLRVVFDYFFPGLMPGDPVDIPEWLIEGWDDFYKTTVQPELQDPANAGKVTQTLRVTGAAYDPAKPSTKEDTLYDLLRYNVMATNDATDKLGGQPFDNWDLTYTGSDNDEQLNQSVRRFHGDEAALGEINVHYQTTGQLSVPLVTLHTTGDPLVPYWHATDYWGKVIRADNVALYEHYAGDHYGHCAFTEVEVLTAFARMIEMVDDPPPYRPVGRTYLPLLSRAE